MNVQRHVCVKTILNSKVYGWALPLPFSAFPFLLLAGSPPSLSSLAGSAWLGTHAGAAVGHSDRLGLAWVVPLPSLAPRFAALPRPRLLLLLLLPLSCATNGTRPVPLPWTRAASAWSAFAVTASGACCRPRDPVATVAVRWTSACRSIQESGRRLAHFQISSRTTSRRLRQPASLAPNRPTRRPWRWRKTTQQQLPHALWSNCQSSKHGGKSVAWNDTCSSSLARRFMASGTSSKAPSSSAARNCMRNCPLARPWTKPRASFAWLRKPRQRPPNRSRRQKPCFCLRKLLFSRPRHLPARALPCSNQMLLECVPN